MTWKCFLVEPTGECRRQLRRYSDRQCPAGGFNGHCDATSVPLENGPVIWHTGENGQRDYYTTEPREWPRDDPRWPVACASCGQPFAESDVWQLFYERLYRAPDGTEHTIRDMPVGAMWRADWLEPYWGGPDARCIAVQLPPGGISDQWVIEQPSQSGGHWTRTGADHGLALDPHAALPRVPPGRGPDGRSRWAQLSIARSKPMNMSTPAPSQKVTAGTLAGAATTFLLGPELPPSPPLALTVVDILLLRPEPEVVGVHAGRVVTAGTIVKHKQSVGDRAAQQLPCNPRRDLIDAVPREHSVAIAAVTGSPHPTHPRPVNFRQEARQCLFGRLALAKGRGASLAAVLLTLLLRGKGVGAVGAGAAILGVHRSLLTLWCHTPGC